MKVLLTQAGKIQLHDAMEENKKENLTQLKNYGGINEWIEITQELIWKCFQNWLKLRV